ncbi:MAG: replication protein [Herbinix sp.]|jgi:hypothetical protein|nr:replication protein [Herbinix sp.]
MAKSKIDLNKFAGGTLQEKFNGALTEVIKNMQDPNTSFKNKRGITISIGFTQNEQRDDAKINISVTTKTSPVLPIETALYMGKDLDTGEVDIREYGKQVAGQMTFTEDVTEDEETGNEPTNKVRNLRELKVK